jgi:hypothetical protein
VVYNGTTFVLWYEDRWSGQEGYAVATSVTPAGPFTTLHDTVLMSGPGRIGDYDGRFSAGSEFSVEDHLFRLCAVFVDPDSGKGYHVRTGVVIEELTPDLCNVTGKYYAFSDTSVEGPSMFKRGSIYYLTLGVGCCACKGGSNVVVREVH